MLLVLQRRQPLLQLLQLGGTRDDVGQLWGWGVGCCGAAVGLGCGLLWAAVGQLWGWGCGQLWGSCGALWG